MAGLGSLIGGGAASLESAGNLRFGTAIKEAIGALTGMIGSLKDMGQMFQTLKGQILDTVGAFRPFAITQFNRAMLDLKAVFGSIFLPILNEATSLVRSFANYMLSLPKTFKDIIASVVKMNLIGGVIATIVGLLGSLTVLLAPINAIIAAVKYLYDTFKSTAGGAMAIGKIVAFVEDGFHSFVGSLKAVWASTAGIRAELADALDGLGTALSDAFTEMKPILAALFGANMVMLKVVWTGVIWAVKTVVGWTTKLWQGLTNLIRPLSSLVKLMGISMPTIQGRKDKDAFGMGWSGASVSDPMSVYNKLTEELMRNSRPADPQETTADSTSQMASIMDRLEKPLIDFLTMANMILKGMLPGAGTQRGIAAGFNAGSGPLAGLMNLLP